jgi:hypothetical protein
MLSTMIEVDHDGHRDMQGRKLMGSTLEELEDQDVVDENARNGSYHNHRDLRNYQKETFSPLQSILLSKLEQIDGMQKVQQFLSGDRMF